MAAGAGPFHSRNGVVSSSRALPRRLILGGPIVSCFTSGSMRMTTSPVRSDTSPRLASSPGPRPPARGPFSLRRRPARPFSHGLGLGLRPGDHEDRSALVRAAERDLRLALRNPLSKLRSHHLGVIGVDVQLLDAVPLTASHELGGETFEIDIGRSIMRNLRWTEIPAAG